MFNLLLGTPSVPQQDVINIINKPAVVQRVEEKEPTLDQKIKSNFYKCNTDTQWIRADNAQCLDKQPTVAQKPVKTAVRASSGGNGYEPGQCTFYIKNKRPDVPNNWGNASAWLGNAQAQGWPTGTTPVVGAIGWTSGHVVYIEAVNGDGTVTYSDMNGRWIAWEVGSGTKPADYYLYIY